MWSEIFTHDYENGEKVAILLIDTQGIFDDQSTVRDYTTIFALSMMLSSVQCYNLKDNIMTNDLHHLEMFTEYGRLALEQSNEKPFQKLVFIVRDWPYAFETPYGWNDSRVIDEIFAGNEDQPTENQQLRARIQSSFEQVQTFLMPHPGMTVAQRKSFDGDLNQVATEFVKYTQELVHSLLTPENLIVKKINGQKIRSKDLLEYLHSFTNLFNSESLPEPKSVLMVSFLHLFWLFCSNSTMAWDFIVFPFHFRKLVFKQATTETSYLILYNECVEHYAKSMQRLFEAEEPIFVDEEIQAFHDTVKNEAIAKVCS